MVYSLVTPQKSAETHLVVIDANVQLVKSSRMAFVKVKMCGIMRLGYDKGIRVHLGPRMFKTFISFCNVHAYSKLYVGFNVVFHSDFFFSYFL